VSTLTQTLFYVVDPMCSWCWAFQRHWETVSNVLSEELSIRYVMGGLAADCDEPMPVPMQRYLQSTWRSIEARTGTQFNHDFWTHCAPKRSTYPACRAVIAAGYQGEQRIGEMIKGIQTAYYLEARNPSELDVLYDCAATIGLDVQRFEQDIHSNRVNEALARDFAIRDQFGVQGFPSLILQHDGDIISISAGYCEAQQVLARIQAALH